MADQNIQNWLKTNAPSKGSKVTRQLILPALEEGGKADTLNLTDPEYNRHILGEYSKAIEEKKDEEKEANKPKYSMMTSDSTKISGKDMSTLLKEVQSLEKLSGKEYIPKEEEKKEIPNEAKKRDEYISQILDLQKQIDAKEEVTTGKGENEKTEMQYVLPDNLSNMAKGQQAALTDSVNFSYGREAIRSPENWKRFMQDNNEPDTGKTINQAAQDKYKEIYEDAKRGNVVLPNQLENFAIERTQAWLETYLKDKYNVDYNAATN